MLNNKLDTITTPKNNIEVNTQNNQLDSIKTQLDSLVNKIAIINKQLKPLKKFFNAIGFSESGNNYNAVNTFGYIGKYQFGYHGLVQARVCDNIVQAKKFRNKFINTPDSLKLNIWSKIEQDKAMLVLITYNRKVLKEYIKNYEGKIINGINITESGILAAAHLSGPTGVKKYFDDNINRTDGYGTSITSYLKKFRGYDV